MPNTAPESFSREMFKLRFEQLADDFDGATKRHWQSWREFNDYADSLRKNAGLTVRECLAAHDVSALLRVGQISNKGEFTLRNIDARTPKQCVGVWTMTLMYLCSNYPGMVDAQIPNLITHPGTFPVFDNEAEARSHAIRYCVASRDACRVIAKFIEAAELVKADTPANPKAKRGRKNHWKDADLKTVLRLHGGIQPPSIAVWVEENRSELPDSVIKHSLGPVQGARLALDAARKSKNLVRK
jgi:hypothetical protein